MILIRLWLWEEAQGFVRVAGYVAISGALQSSGVELCTEIQGLGLCKRCKMLFEDLCFVGARLGGSRV